MCFFLKAPSHYLSQCRKSSVRSCVIHMRGISQEMIIVTILKIINFRLQPHFPGAKDALRNAEFCLVSVVSTVGSVCHLTLQWRHNGRDSVSNHQPHHCLLNRLFRRRSKKISKLCLTGLCAGNSPGTGEFPAQMASYAENASIWWRHHDLFVFVTARNN